MDMRYLWEDAKGLRGRRVEGKIRFLSCEKCGGVFAKMNIHMAKGWKFEYKVREKKVERN